MYHQYIITIFHILYIVKYKQTKMKKSLCLWIKNTGELWINKKSLLCVVLRCLWPLNERGPRVEPWGVPHVILVLWLYYSVLPNQKQCYYYFYTAKILFTFCSRFCAGQGLLHLAFSFLPPNTTTNTMFKQNHIIVQQSFLESLALSLRWIVKTVLPL